MKPLFWFVMELANLVCARRSVRNNYQSTRNRFSLGPRSDELLPSICSNRYADGNLFVEILLTSCSLCRFPESKLQPVVTNRAPALLAGQPELAASARAAFTAYLRDYCFIPKASGSTAIAESFSMSSVFQPSRLPVDEFAASLGAYSYVICVSTSTNPLCSGHHRLIFECFVA